MIHCAAAFSLYTDQTQLITTRVRTVLVLVYWILDNIHRYWIVLLLGDIFSLWHPIWYWSDSSFEILCGIVLYHILLQINTLLCYILISVRVLGIGITIGQYYWILSVLLDIVLTLTATFSVSSLNHYPLKLITGYGLFFTSATDLMSLFILFFLLEWPIFKTSLRLCRFKLDRDEVWQNCASSKQGLIDRVGFTIWRHTFQDGGHAIISRSGVPPPGD